MKTYFDYGAPISSKNSAESIAVTKGTGPILGFGTATINQQTGTIVISPLPETTDPMYNIMVGRMKQWYITKNSTDSEAPQTTFAGIAKDGTIFSSDAESIQLSINGSRGRFNEVLVFAYHVTVSEPIENPVTFVAFWSEGDESFYEMYKKSLDPYFPLPENQRELSFNEVDGTSQLNYNLLEEKVKSSCTYYYNNLDGLVLMGIFGVGDNPVTGTTNEKFALVPYDGSFPNHMNYTPSIHNSLKESISRIESILGPNTSKNREGITSLDDLMNSLKASIIEELSTKITLATLPIGSIILWEGTTIPEGWAEYTPAAGRVVVGYQSGGISVPSSIVGTTLNNPNTTVLTNPGDLYNPVDGDYAAKITSTELPSHRHGVGVDRGGQDNSSDDDKSTIQNWENRNTSLNGSVGDRGATVNVVSGGIYTSKNFQGDTQTEASGDVLNVVKLPKSITLKYIKKIS